MFVLANNYFVKSSHTQLLMVNLVPWLFILIYGFCLNLNKDKRKRIYYGVSSILMTGLLIFSGFYIASFAIFFLGIFTLVWCFYSWLADEKPFLKIFIFIKNNIFEMVIYLLTAVAVLIPSVWVYLPVILENGGRSFSVF